MTGGGIRQDGGAVTGGSGPAVEAGDQVVEGREKLVLMVGYRTEYGGFYCEEDMGHATGCTYNPLRVVQYP